MLSSSHARLLSEELRGQAQGAPSWQCVLSKLACRPPSMCPRSPSPALKAAPLCCRDYDQEFSRLLAEPFSSESGSARPFTAPPNIVELTRAFQSDAVSDPFCELCPLASSQSREGGGKTVFLHSILEHTLPVFADYLQTWIANAYL